jgi:hypothetical protein
MGKNEINEVLNDLNQPRFKSSKYINEQIQKKVKGVMLYKLISKDNNVFKQCKRTGIKQFKEFYCLNNNNDAKIVGFTPNYIGVKPSLPIKATNYVKHYIFNEWDSIRTKYPFIYQKINENLSKPRIVFEAGYDTATEHLRENFSPSTLKLTRENVLDILQKSDFKWFKTPLIECTDDNELSLTTNFNPKSRPGMYTSMVISKKRGYSHIYSVMAAKHLFSQVKKYPLKNYNLWEILGREKDIKINKGSEETVVSTRIVVSTEEYATLLASWPAQKAQLAYELYDKDRKFHLRGEFNETKFFKIACKRLEYDYYVSADWRFYDSNVDKIIIQISMSIICGGLIETMGKEGERLMFYLLNYQICKYVAVPPGIVVELNKAVPSGSAFTTLCNCVSNLIYWAIIGNEIYGDNYADMMDVEVYGDDAYVFFKNHDRLLEIDNIITKIGLKSDPLLCLLKPTDFKANINDDHDFLKRQFSLTDLQWNLEKMLTRIIYQTKNRKANEQFELLFSYLISAPGNNEYNSFIIDIMKYMVDNLPDEISDDNKIKYETINQYINESKKRIGVKCSDEEPYNVTIKGMMNSKEYVLKSRGYKKILIDKNKAKLLNLIGLPYRLLNDYVKYNIDLVPEHLEVSDFSKSMFTDIEKIKRKAFEYVSLLHESYSLDTS